jgi:hypothetical protein
VSLGGFDTHTNQAGTQARLLKEVANGLVALKSALDELGKWNDAVVLTYAEFGRRPKENLSNGTDHGTANVHFALGGRVAGGFYGEAPALDDPPRAFSSPIVISAGGKRQLIVWTPKARQATKSFEGMALYHLTFDFLIRPEGSESVEGMWVTKDYFRVLGLKPLLGRDFADSDIGAANSRPTTIVLGYSLWQKRFQGDRNIVGKTVQMYRSGPLQVIGVMPPKVRFLPDTPRASEPNYDLNSQVDFWRPYVPDETKPKDEAGAIIARLKQNASVASAQTELKVMAARQARSDSDVEGITAAVRSLLDDLNKGGAGCSCRCWELWRWSF